MSVERYNAYKDALEIAKAVIAASGSVAAPNKETAESIADFVEALANRLSEIKS